MRGPRESLNIWAFLYFLLIELVKLVLDARDHEGVGIFIRHFGEGHD
jgi:hypothetical protein